MKTDHSVALNVLFLTFARQHVYLRQTKRARKWGVSACQCQTKSPSGRGWILQLRGMQSSQFLQWSSEATAMNA